MPEKRPKTSGIVRISTGNKQKNDPMEENTGNNYVSYRICQVCPDNLTMKGNTGICRKNTVWIQIFLSGS
ncbi:MAG TPA: hypothetical protein DDX57_04365 [Bacteroidales bacterium]|nr:hypothetical protein [Bacteroidales bacterium]HCB62391.1 hypothetical protein [Bacteroidales bacterium]